MGNNGHDHSHHQKPVFDRLSQIYQLAGLVTDLPGFKIPAEIWDRLEDVITALRGGDSTSQAEADDLFETFRRKIRSFIINAPAKRFAGEIDNLRAAGIPDHLVAGAVKALNDLNKYVSGIDRWDPDALAEGIRYHADVHEALIAAKSALADWQRDKRICRNLKQVPAVKNRQLETIRHHRVQV